MLSIVDALINNCKKNDKEICFNVMNNSGFKYQYTWCDYLTNVIKIASAFTKLGLEKGDCILIKYDEMHEQHINHKCFFIMMACIYTGVFFINITANINIETNDQSVKKSNVLEIYKCKLIFSFKNNIVLWNKYSSCVINDEWETFESLLNIVSNEYINPLKNNNEENKINENEIIHFVVLNDDKKIIEINGAELNKAIDVIDSNYNIGKGRFVAHGYPLSVESIIFDFYFHVLTSSCLHIGYKYHLEHVRPTFVYGNDAYWNELYKNIDYKINYKPSLFYLRCWIVIYIIIIAQKANLFCYSYDMHFNKSSIIFMCMKIFVEIVYWTTRKILKIYKMFLGLGLNKCKAFINISKKINIKILQLFYKLDIPIKYIFSCTYVKKTAIHSYAIISITNTYDPYTMGHPITDIGIDKSNNIYIIHCEKNNDKKYIFIGCKGILLNNGKLQII